jgi:hypothetical protein
MAGLEPDAMNAVQALAAARTPDDGAAERAWAVMQHRLLDGPPPIDIGPTTSVDPRTRWIAVGAAVAAAVLLAVGIASWSAGWIAGIDARAPDEAPYSTVRPDERPEASTMREPVAPAPDQPSPAAAPVVESTPSIVEDAAPTTAVAREAKPKTVRRPAPEPEPSAPKTTTLEAEMKLLARANAAMRAGDAARALAVLDEHARDFARGQLAPEREYKRALALCEVGRVEQARAVADAFAKAHPRSPLRGKAQSVCREEAAR